MEFVLTWLLSALITRKPLINYFAAQITGLESDMKEVAWLLEMCERKRVRDILSQEQKKIEDELALKQQQREQQRKRDSRDKTDTAVKGYTVKINNYGVYTLIILLTSYPALYLSECLFVFLHFRLGPVRKICEGLHHIKRSASNPY